MKIRNIFFSLILVFSLIVPIISYAVLPSEVLDDPVLEQRARDISKNLRCLVCQNQNIDDSDAELAADLRLLVRERLVAGDSDEEVIDYIVARYGEYVLLNPKVGPHTIILWTAMPIIFVIGLVFLIILVKKQKNRAGKIALTKEEQAALEALEKDDG